MQKFYHNNLSKLNALQTLLNVALVKYNRKDFDADLALLNCLTSATDTYKALGNLDRENQILSLKAEYVTAQRGINPTTYERVSIRRHEMIQTICFKILQQLELFLRTDTTTIQQILIGAKDILTQIIVAAFQANLITDTTLKLIKTQKDIEVFWIKLGQDGNIALGQKRVLLQVSKFDVFVLLGELLDAVKK